MFYDGRRPRDMDNFKISKTKKSCSSFIFILITISCVISGVGFGLYYLNLESDFEQITVKQTPKYKSVTIDFGVDGSDNIDACLGDVVTVHWKAIRNIQETTTQTCASNHIGTPTIEYQPVGYSRTFSNDELAAKPGGVRYFKSTIGCGSGSARFKVSCSCSCTQEWRPVCCIDKTYGNQCEASCNGCQQWQSGECKL